ncbi:MAG: winged helix-turn-helix domain-containing protein [Gammaproteobacteria bacterium]|nr:winged helix-turn-helix domain-containing protein [Gammaproteobacteria bacterium]
MTSALLNITVPISTPTMISVLDSYVRQKGLQASALSNAQWSVRCSLIAAYEFLEGLVRATEPNNTTHPSVSTLTSHHILHRQHSQINQQKLASPQTSEQKLLLAAVDTLTLAIAQAITAAVLQGNKSMVLPLDYSLPNLPLKYFFPFDRSDANNRNTVYLFGRSVKLPPTRVLILEQLLQSPEKTLVSQQSLVDFTYGLRGLTSEEVWHAHMSYLRSAIAPELQLETERGVGYRVIINRQYLIMPY